MSDRPRVADTLFVLARALRTPPAHTAAAHTVGRCVVFAALAAPLGVQTWGLPFRFADLAVLPDGRHVYNALPFERDRTGPPLHVYDLASRRITRSLGDEGVRAERLVGEDGFCTYAEHSDLGEPKYVVWSVALSGHDR